MPTTSVEAGRLAAELGLTVGLVDRGVSELRVGERLLRDHGGRVRETFRGPLAAPLVARYETAADRRASAATLLTGVRDALHAIRASADRHRAELAILEGRVVAAQAVVDDREAAYKRVAWSDHTPLVSGIESFVRSDVDHARAALDAAHRELARARRAIEEVDDRWRAATLRHVGNIDGIARRLAGVESSSFVSGIARQVDPAGLEYRALWARFGPAGQATMGLADLAARAESGRPLSPDEVTRLRQSPGLAEAFANRHPELAGNLDGFPAVWRDHANRILLEQAIHASSGKDRARLEWVRSVLHEAWRVPVLLLRFDPKGDGRMVASFGDPDEADNVAVYVPGVNTDIGDARQELIRAASLQDDIAGMQHGTAAGIFYLDYDPPETTAGGIAGIVVSSKARERASTLEATLPDFLVGLRATNPPARVTVVAHSFGTFAVGRTASHTRLPVDAVVLVGSPGFGVDDASELQLNPGAQVFAATASDDKVGWVGERHGLAGFLLGTGVAPLALVGAATELGVIGDYGADPTHAGTGVQSFDVSDVHGHSQYFGTVSKDGALLLDENNSTQNIARIAVGGLVAP